MHQCKTTWWSDSSDPCSIPSARSLRPFESIRAMERKKVALIDGLLDVGLVSDGELLRYRVLITGCLSLTRPRIAHACSTHMAAYPVCKRWILSDQPSSHLQNNQGELMLVGLARHGGIEVAGCADLLTYTAFEAQAGWHQSVTRVLDRAVSRKLRNSAVWRLSATRGSALPGIREPTCCCAIGSSKLAKLTQPPWPSQGQDIAVPHSTYTR